MNSTDLCFELRKASRAITRFYDSCLYKEGIRSTQLQMLIALQSFPGRSYTAIARELMMERTGFLRNLACLKYKGLVEDIKIGNKSKRCDITKDGIEAIKRCNAIFEKAHKELSHEFKESGFENNDVDRILDILDLVSRIVAAKNEESKNGTD